MGNGVRGFVVQISRWPVYWWCNWAAAADRSCHPSRATGGPRAVGHHETGSTPTPEPPWQCPPTDRRSDSDAATATVSVSATAAAAATAAAPVAVAGASRTGTDAEAGARAVSDTDARVAAGCRQLPTLAAGRARKGCRGARWAGPREPSASGHLASWKGMRTSLSSRSMPSIHLPGWMPPGISKNSRPWQARRSSTVTSS